MVIAWEQGRNSQSLRLHIDGVYKGLVSCSDTEVRVIRVRVIYRAPIAQLEEAKRYLLTLALMGELDD